VADPLAGVVVSSRGVRRRTPLESPARSAGVRSERSEDPLARLHGVEARSNPAARAAVACCV